MHNMAPFLIFWESETRFSKFWVKLEKKINANSGINTYLRINNPTKILLVYQTRHFMATVSQDKITASRKSLARELRITLQVSALQGPKFLAFGAV